VYIRSVSQQQVNASGVACSFHIAVVCIVLRGTWPMSRNFSYPFRAVFWECVVVEFLRTLSASGGTPSFGRGELGWF
jgi:hypothetical protein